MRAIVVSEPGDYDVLHIAEVPDPTPAPGEVLLRIRGTSVNRADTAQRRGMYPPPPGVSDVIGMDAAGEIEALGEGVRGWEVGQRAMALLGGGGYAEKCVVPAVQLMPVPDNLDIIAAGSIPLAWLTAHDNMVTRGGLRSGGSVLIHGGSSGVGTAAIQIAKRMGARVIVTAGTPERARRCRDLGADEAVVYKDEDFAARVHDVTQGKGVDVVLDHVGAPYLERNLESLGVEGRLLMIGMMGGATAEINLGAMMPKRLSVGVTTMRRRSVEDKALVVANATRDLVPGFAGGSLHPVVDRVLPLDQAAEAHRALEAGEIFGKVVLQP